MNLTLPVLTDADMEYLESYNHMEMDNYSFCNITNIARDIVVEDHINKEPLCNLYHIQDSYQPVHGHLALTVCTLGTIFNMVNIMVLTHKDMRTNPINLILTGIALADCLVMVEYIPFSIHMYLLDDKNRDVDEKYSLAWGIFLLFHTNFTLMIHTVSIWLTLSLAIWRLIMIKFCSLAVTLCTLPRCRILLILGYVVPLLLTIPNLLSIQIGSHQRIKTDGSCATLYMLQVINESLFALNMWLYSFFLKLLPCLFLTMLTACLIRELYKAEENSSRLKGQQRTTGGYNPLTPAKTARQKNNDKTTKLLSIILTLFLIAEFPQGILGMLSAILGQQFFLECYNPVGEMMDMVALTNSAANFILYCLMSSQFRKTMRKIYSRKDTTINRHNSPMAMTGLCKRSEVHPTSSTGGGPIICQSSAV